MLKQTRLTTIHFSHAETDESDHDTLQPCWNRRGWPRYIIDMLKVTCLIPTHYRNAETDIVDNHAYQSCWNWCLTTRDTLQPCWNCLFWPRHITSMMKLRLLTTKHYSHAVNYFKDHNTNSWLWHIPVILQSCWKCSHVKCDLTFPFRCPYFTPNRIWSPNYSVLVVIGHVCSILSSLKITVRIFVINVVTNQFKICVKSSPKCVKKFVKN